MPTFLIVTVFCCKKTEKQSLRCIFLYYAQLIIEEKQLQKLCFCLS